MKEDRVKYYAKTRKKHHRGSRYQQRANVWLFHPLVLQSTTMETSRINCALAISFLIGLDILFAMHGCSLTVSHKITGQALVFGVIKNYHYLEQISSLLHHIKS